MKLYEEGAITKEYICSYQCKLVCTELLHKFTDFRTCLISYTCECSWGGHTQTQTHTDTDTHTHTHRHTHTPEYINSNTSITR